MHGTHGGICQEKVPRKLKVLLYKTLIKPALLYRNDETRSITQRQEERIKAKEMRMLRQVFGISWEDHIRKEDIRREAGVEAVST